MVDEILPRLKHDLALAEDRWRKRDLILGVMDKVTLLGGRNYDLALLWKQAGYIVELYDNGRFLEGWLYKTNDKGEKDEEITDEEFQQLVTPIISQVLRECLIYFDDKTLDILEKGNHQYQDIWDEARGLNKKREG